MAGKSEEEEDEDDPTFSISFMSSSLRIAKFVHSGIRATTLLGTLIFESHSCAKALSPTQFINKYDEEEEGIDKEEGKDEDEMAK
jgi:hypothetical protein